MTEIVINNEYGGFGLSPEGLEAYAAKKGKKLYWFAHDFGATGYDSNLTPIDYTPSDESILPFHLAYDIPNPDNHTKSFSGRDIPRDDPDLIAVVKELGEKANSRYSRLAIVEIPDDVEWCIEEYDGNEWVSEKHRTWG